jgi:DNA-binding NarL/FixJ family response regulator
MHGVEPLGGAHSVLIADENQGDVGSIAALLRRAGYWVVEAETGHVAVEIARVEPPDLALLGVTLPDGSGFEIFRELRDVCGLSLRVVFLSTRPADPRDEVAALLLGADDYVTKPFVPDVLLARIRRLAYPVTSSPSKAPELTPREREVLKLLVEGRRETEIAGDLYITPKTVAKHIEHILGKLGVHSRAQAVAFAARRDLGLERTRRLAPERD